jgi:hypothetical protein
LARMLYQNNLDASKGEKEVEVASCTYNLSLGLLVIILRSKLPQMHSIVCIA